jgi:hypothetical protein
MKSGPVIWRGVSALECPGVRRGETKMHLGPLPAGAHRATLENAVLPEADHKPREAT